MSVSQYASVTASGAEGQANLNLWLKDVSVYVPGIHRSVLKRQLILACREFFEQSWAWRATLGPLNIVANQETYMLSPFNSTTDVVGVIGASVNGVALAPLPARPIYPSGAQSTGTVDRPSGYFMLTPDVMALAPIPNPTSDNPATLSVYVALKPKASVLQVPKIAVTNFYDAILAGVLYRVLNQPAKPYTNLQLSAYFENRFRTLIGLYAGAAKKGFGNAPAWRFPYFGNGRSWINGGW